MKYFIQTLLFLTISSTSFACINGSGFNVFGEKTSYDYPIKFISSIRPKLSQTEIDKKLKELTIKLEKDSSNWDFINLSIYLIYNNQLDSAITILEKVQQRGGDSYSIYSNLGVAYELKGNNDSAYYWTKKGLEINPSSHMESEWIHLKILEAQMAINNDANWLKNNTVLGHTIGNDSIPTTILNDNYARQRLAIGIEYQLRERMYFVKPKNKVVAQLLLQLADLYSLSVDLNNASGTYLLAQRYDPDLAPIINKRLAKVRLVLTPIETTYLDSLESSSDTLLPIISDVFVAKEELPKFKEKESNNLIWYLFGGVLLIILLVLRFKLSKKSTK